MREGDGDGFNTVHRVAYRGKREEGKADKEVGDGGKRQGVDNEADGFFHGKLLWGCVFVQNKNTTKSRILQVKVKILQILRKISLF